MWMLGWWKNYANIATGFCRQRRLRFSGKHSVAHIRRYEPAEATFPKLLATMKRSFKLWQYILLAAMIGVLPMSGILLYVISTSVNKDVNFAAQEMRGNTFQRPLEQLLDLFPRYQATARQVLAGNEAAKTSLTELQQEIDLQMATLAANYNGELGQALKFTDAELAARKREDARLAAVQTGWQNLKGASLTVAAGDEAVGKLVAAIRMMTAHAGDLSNLILDSDLDSYYLMDVTLCALPQTQQRLSDITLQVGDWLRAGTAAAHKSDIAVMAAMLQQDDQDRITGDAQTSLSEDKNFYGVSELLQKNLPPAIAKYTEANQKFLAGLNRIVAGENVPPGELETAGWNARAESFRLWTTSVNELDGLLSIRLAVFRHHRLFSYGATGATLVVVLLVIGVIERRLNLVVRRITQDLNLSSEQVAAAAIEVSSASHSLAEGSGEQAASIEETSSSLEELSSMTKRNADNSQKANELSRQTRAAADKGVADMEEMNAAMAAIKASSDDIAKIIKTIDEIAFQTNILALNAAVEAARAGEAGLGFAVVADEVRNLARRSADAAKETAAKIEGAISRTGQGVALSAKVSAALNDIVAKARQVDELASEVAGASREQTEGITQINSAVGQMDKVTQHNAASAEESAAAAAELNTQAGMMKQSVSELLTLVDGETPAETFAAAVRRPPPPRPELSFASAPAGAGIIAWDEEKMATGVTSVDGQHRELINRINDLHADCLAGKAREELMEHLNFLGSYAKTHFAEEENIMAEHRCPSRGQNKAAHAKFLKDYEQLVVMVKENGASSRVALKLKQMLGDWLTSHICRIDTSLRQCPSAQRSPAANRRNEIPLAGDFKNF